MNISEFSKKMKNFSCWLKYDYTSRYSLSRYDIDKIIRSYVLFENKPIFPSNTFDEEAFAQLNFIKQRVEQ